MFAVVDISLALCEGDKPLMLEPGPPWQQQTYLEEKSVSSGSFE